ncbi:MAG TPA: carboxypeptidase-like regulatory domain-containing protein, partial [Blastocatellia bacterium]
MRLNLFTSSIVLSLLLFAAGFHAPARAQRQGDSGAASISGRVTIEGKPAPGVVVVVTGINGAADAGKLSDTTDSEGRFKVTGLKPGEYEITPQSHVFVLSNRNPSLFNDRRITLGAGETVDDVSLELTRGCVVTGRVIDENGRPVIGGYVSLGRPRDIGASRTEIEYFNPLIPGAGETDDRGVYRIFGVPAGHYLVMVSTQAGLGRNAINYQVFYPNASDQSKAKLIELSAGEEKTDINITIVPPERTYTVSGRLIDAASGKPVPYVLVWSWALDGGANRRIFQSYIDNRITDEEGSFLIAGLSSGRHLLSIGTMSDRDTEWYS